MPPMSCAARAILPAIDLGDAASIDRHVDLLRKALTDSKDLSVRKPASALYKLVMAPILDAVGDAPRLLISPDGNLNLVPFAALVDPAGRYFSSRAPLPI